MHGETVNGATTLTERFLGMYAKLQKAIINFIKSIY